MIIKHLYQRQVMSKGKPVKAWYYWYWLDGKQVRKSCGQHGQICTVKRDAQAYIESLKDEDLDTSLKAKKILLKDYCQGMYDDGSAYRNYYESKHKKLTKTTWRIKRYYLKQILDRYGDIEVTELKPRDMDNWITGLPLSTSVRNQYLQICDDFFKSLYKDNLIQVIPLFERCTVVVTNEKGILTQEEIDFLFPDPDDIESINKIWTTGKRKLVPDYFAYWFATYIYIILTTGMRSGEARALTDDQFLDNNIILLNAMFDAEDKRVNHLKKGDDKKPKWRIALIPDKAKRMIENCKKMVQHRSTKYFIEMNDLPLSRWYTNNHFRQVLKQNGIDADGRNISAHSLRFTYNTIMRSKIEDENLRLLLGHDTKKMTDYYDKSKVMDHLPELLSQKSAINSVWN